MSAFLQRLLFSALIVSCVMQSAHAQSLLNKTVTVQATGKPLKTVLDGMAKQGSFYFSYNSNIIKEDSFVSLNVQGKPVRHVLDMLFSDKLEYKETKTHIILQRSGGYWYVSGHITDQTTGEGLMNVSVYEKEQLVAALTDAHGYFKLKLKDKVQPTVINVSKSWYEDTAIVVKPGADYNISVSILPKAIALDSVIITPNSGVEHTWLGSLFLSSRQRIQSMNLNKYFTELPYQASVIPGWSTQGRMAPQVENKVSFNVLGGYTGGVNGAEVAGIFNIVQKDVRYVEVAGVFNITGGDVEGVQVAGVYNQVLGKVSGVQVAGVTSVVKRNVDGVQVSGVYSHTSAAMSGVQVAGFACFARDSVHGLQVSGVINHAGKHSKGSQIAGMINILPGEIDGVQIGGLVNYTEKLYGTQIGLINVSDTSAGYSIGLFNFSRKGIHTLGIAANEVTNLNVAFRSGNEKLYSILLGGMNVGPLRAYSFGYGIGMAARMGRRLTLNPEVSSESVYLGDWDNIHLLTKLNLNLNFRLNKFLSVYAGPVLSVYYSPDNPRNEGYMPTLPPAGYRVTKVEGVSSWLGWNAGIALF